MLRFIRTLVVVAALVTPLLVPTPALAHERREIGPYTFVVGWENEPSFASQKNGVSLRIFRTDNNEAVEEAEKTLKLEVIQGSVRREFPLRGVFRTPGSYTSDIVPAKEGDYRFRFFGIVGTTNVEQVFDSAEGKFNKAESLQTIMFPAAETAAVPGGAPAAGPASAELSQLSKDVVAARVEATSASTFATIGAFAGVLGAILGVLALVSSARNRPGTGDQRLETPAGARL